MADQTKETGITSEDLLFISLHRALSDWLKIEPMSYKRWLNQLLPLEEGEKKMFPLRPIDIEYSCLLTAIIIELQDQVSKGMIDHYFGTAASELIGALKVCSFVHPARMRGMEDREAVYWGVRREKNQAFYVEAQPTKHDRIVEILGDIFK
jgi:hypothetical protein